MPLILLPLLIVVVLIVLVPISIVQRYRMGTSRQRARGWLININVAGLALSAIVFLASAAFTAVWVPHAFSYSAIGLAGGSALGGVGLWATRWEPARDALHYTPNRLLVLGITVVISARIAYGMWRAVHTWRAGLLDDSWAGAAGIAGSMAAGAVVLGYYLAYWLGVRRRLRRIARRA